MCAAALCAVLVASALTIPLADQAWAEVRKSDLIVGSSMEQRGVSAARCPSIDADYAIVVDANGTVYFERDATTPTQIASITKVMCALVALDQAPLDTQVTVSARAAEVGESSANLAEGDVMTLETALKALMMPSGNDAAIAIAESVGHLLMSKAQESGSTLTASDGSAITGNTDDDALAVFVALMNQKAAELGCTDTVFENPHGLDDGEFSGSHHSTAADVAKFCAAAMANDTFRSIVSTDETTIQVTRDGQTADIVLESTDELLGVLDGACGIKTGFTDLAGACFAGACERDGVELYAIVLHSSSEAQRFTDAETLFEWVYDNLTTYTLAHSDQTAQMTINGEVRDVPVVAEVAQTCWPDKTVRATFADPDASVEVFALAGNISQSFEFYEPSGTVNAGDVIGKATFYQRNTVVATVDVVACENSVAPDFLQGIGIWWNRLIGNITGSADTAQSVVLNDTPLIYDKQSLYVS